MAKGGFAALNLFMKQRNKDLKPSNNNGSKCILTLSDITGRGFYHLYFCHSNLFRVSGFGISDLNDRVDCLRPLPGGFLRPPDLRKECLLTSHGPVLRASLSSFVCGR